MMKILKNPLLLAVVRWFDSEAGMHADSGADAAKVDWPRILPLIVLHVMCLGVFWVGWSPAALAVALTLYLIRMFAITGFYHRYFSHKSFRAGRVWQFFFAVMGNTAVQRGPLWWAAHHRHHHRYADQQEDIHSPLRHGFLWSHIGWLTSKENFKTQYRYIRDWMKYPELRWLNRFDTVVPILLAAALYLLGELLAAKAPGLKTDGPQLLIWGFFVSTVLLLHGTFTINSLDHMFGSRRYDTPDTSRNNPWLALLTLGEGWHNNHHYYAVSAHQGFFWWEIDITYFLLKMLSWIGIIYDLRKVPDSVRMPKTR